MSGSEEILESNNTDPIMELKNIAAMAENYYALLAPHCPLGPIALASCIQVDASIPNFLIQETLTLGTGYLLNPFSLSDGYIELPNKPGLGIELNEDFLKENEYDGNWLTPKKFYEDGSIADW